MASTHEVQVHLDDALRARIAALEDELRKMTANRDLWMNECQQGVAKHVLHELAWWKANVEDWDDQMFAVLEGRWASREVAGDEL